MKAHLADKQVTNAWPPFAAGLLLAALLATPIAIVATFAQAPAKLELAQAQSLGESGGRPPVVYPGLNDDLGSFAFGYLEFDWDPRSPGGVPGFDTWPPGSPRRR